MRLLRGGRLGREQPERTENQREDGKPGGRSGRTSSPLGRHSPTQRQSNRVGLLSLHNACQSQVHQFPSVPFLSVFE